MIKAWNELCSEQKRLRLELLETQTKLTNYIDLYQSARADATYERRRCTSMELEMVGKLALLRDQFRQYQEYTTVSEQKMTSIRQGFLRDAAATLASVANKPGPGWLDDYNQA